VETVAALALKAGIGPRVTASHTTAMHSYNGAYTFHKARLFVVNFIAVNIQRAVIFPRQSESDMQRFSYPNGEALLEEALKLGADVVGAIPHFEFTREYGV
jgi:cytosine/adenosine deaminase-related metal-dependent hydrolase